jgi:hypothetical protein
MFSETPLSQSTFFCIGLCHDGLGKSGHSSSMVLMCHHMGHLDGVLQKVAFLWQHNALCALLPLVHITLFPPQAGVLCGWFLLSRGT